MLIKKAKPQKNNMCAGTLGPASDSKTVTNDSTEY